MANQTRIEELASIIGRNTTSIQDALRVQNLPTPSFEPDVEVMFPPETETARNAVLDATLELHDLLLYPMSLWHRKFAHNQGASMKAIARWNIANCFEPGEEISFPELAKRCGLDEKPLCHLLRQAITMRIFQEPRKGIIAHTAASAKLRDSKMQDWLIGGVEDLWPASVRLVDAMAKWPGSEEPNHTGFNIARETDAPLYQQVASDPAFGKRFGNVLTAMIANNPAFDAKHLHRSYDWASLGEGLVVDIGGGHGSIVFSLAASFPRLRFIVQELENVVRSGAAATPAELKDRVEFMPHDFFTQQTVSADVYLLRWVFHNWSDKYSIRILKALVPTLKPGSRILVQDGCLPEPGAIPLWIEQDLRQVKFRVAESPELLTSYRAMDLTMATFCNAYERDADEWKALFAKADSRFNLVGITQPPGSALSLLEVEWVESSDKAPVQTGNH